jgi:thermitase
MRRIRPIALALLALLALALAPAAARADDAPVGEQIIVRHRAGLDAAARADLRAGSDTRLDRRLRLANTDLVSVTDGTRAQALAELRADPDVVSAEPNRPVRTLTSDPFWSDLWGLFNNGSGGARVDADIDAEQAWTVTRGSGVTVAVVDTGVQADHPDLAGRLVAGYDFVNGDSDPADGYGHGTHVAGIIAADQGNGIGIAGVAPLAQIMPLKALADTGDGTMADVIEAFDYAPDHGAQVVNASLGADGGVSPALDAVFAAHPDTLYVVAAGNAGRDNDVDPTTPCVSTAPNVLCVGATDDTDARAGFSNYGASTVDLFAPGVDILSTYNDSWYWFMDGTSMATPYVAGAAALAFAATGKRGAQLAQQITSTVDPVSGLAGLSVSGGRLNAARAVGAAVDAPPAPVIASAQGGVHAATLSLTPRESDIASFRVYEGATLVATSSSESIALSGLADGPHTFTVVARNTSGMQSPASSPASVTVTNAPLPPPPPPPAPPTVTPQPELPLPGAPIDDTGGTDRGGTRPAPVTGVKLVTRHGRTSLVFRVGTSTRVTVTLSRLHRGRYRATRSRTVRMAAGRRSLPVRSRLLGMRVPTGRWKVTVRAGKTTATVAFTRR